jgi:hypothetical protein
MTKFYRSNIAIVVSLLMMASGLQVKAGNIDRAGSAGASELLINPWAKSSGWGGINFAGVRNVEAMNLNVAGVAFTKKTEIAFSHTVWLKGSQIYLNTLGLTQKVGESGAIGLSVMAMDFGDIQVTTTDMPDGGLGTFSPSFLNIGLVYSKEFSNSIYGGIGVRLISEAIADVKAFGVSFDAGIQYVTGFNEAKDNLKFGITLKNVGPAMRFNGDGLSQRVNITTTSPNYSLTMQQRAERFELPALVAIGGSYDFKLAEDHRLTPALSFIANSFVRDNFGVGLEYGFKNLFMLRAGYQYEKDINDPELRTNGLTGFSAGATVAVPFSKNTRSFGIDYSFRSTAYFDGTHSIGVRITL